jgi:hypothetical protein
MDECSGLSVEKTNCILRCVTEDVFSSLPY